MLRVACVVLLVFLAACGPRGTLTAMPPGVQAANVRTVFVATTRTVDPDTGIYGGGRLRGNATFARYDVSIPPDRDLGQITWPREGRPPDPRTDFLTTDVIPYDDATAFRRELARSLAALPASEREVTVFTHGFNNTFAEGLYRIAQMSNDLEFPGLTVHYSWPSIGKPLGYVRDRDSILFARDGFEQLLNEVAAAGAQRIVIVGHSMGGALTMETLRQMAIRGDRKVRPRIGGVLLLSPDLDIDVFLSQADAIGKLPQPFLIFTSQKDRALALAARLTGVRRERLGNLRDVSKVASLEVTVVDVAAFSTGSGHLNVGNSPALIRILSRIGDIDTAFGADRSGRAGLLPGIVLTVQSATEIILTPVIGTRQ
ncbi:MAG: alpha/beta hydrolase [Gemmobacter sp.]